MYAVTAKEGGSKPPDHEMTNVKFFVSQMIFRGGGEGSSSGCPGSCLCGLGLVEFLSGSRVVHEQLREHRHLYPKESRAVSVVSFQSCPLPARAANLLSIRFFSNTALVKHPCLGKFRSFRPCRIRTTGHFPFPFSFPLHFFFSCFICLALFTSSLNLW